MGKSKDIFRKFILNFRLFFANSFFTFLEGVFTFLYFFFCLDTVQNNLYNSYIPVDLLSGCWVSSLVYWQKILFYELDGIMVIFTA